MAREVLEKIYLPQFGGVTDISMNATVAIIQVKWVFLKLTIYAWMGVMRLNQGVPLKVKNEILFFFKNCVYRWIYVLKKKNKTRLN